MIIVKTNKTTNKTKTDAEMVLVNKYIDQNE